ncbi:hypothetical protein WMY93_006652 [Mugilogobius chulae]|uniref:HAP1 N-terminal domain-containing protein n=1 Tax=Mugilogobius chulae TaxID=88201 RepID=A0AAW0PU24_9GOBI
MTVFNVTGQAPHGHREAGRQSDITSKTKLDRASTAPCCASPVSPLPWPQQAPLDPHSAFCLHEGRGETAGALPAGPLPLLLNASGNLRDVEPPLSQDVSTLTDLCSDLPELEIVSLLSEGQPNYTLRADTVFGYDNEDWLHTPLVPPEVVLGLTCEQIEETFNLSLQPPVRWACLCLQQCYAAPLCIDPLLRLRADGEKPLGDLP